MELLEQLNLLNIQISYYKDRFSSLTVDERWKLSDLEDEVQELKLVINQQELEYKEVK